MAYQKNKPKNIDFNPVKEDTSGVQAKRAIWSSKALDLALDGIKQGRKLVANPFYENNTKLLKGDLVYDRTQDEIQEWLRCKNDIIYFVEKYCKLMTPEGIKNVKLRDYQVKYLKHLINHRLSIYLACRQCGKTTTSAVFMLHYILFNVDKNALVLGNKRKTAVEILDKAKKIYLELPYFLKPGIYKWNEAEIVLDNGCRLMSEATTINSGISFTFHCVLSDEFAHIQPNILDKFYNNIFPTITAGKARFMITSTQNGYNLFYRLYKAAEAGTNEYAPFKTNWDEVPEWDPEQQKWVARDEAWHQLQVANYGSEEAFNAQFGTNFDISANTLISQKVISKRNTRLVEFVEKEMLGVPYSSMWYWHPKFDPADCKTSCIVLTTDIAEGGGGDSTVCAVHRFIEPGSNKLECVGYFKSNNLSRELATLSIQVFVSNMCHPDRTLLSFERNIYGEIFVKQMIENTEKNVPGCSKFDPSLFVKYYNESGTKFNYGIKITSGNKTAHCMLYKEDYEKDLLINDASQYMIELNNFSDDGNGKYSAAFGHDDMVMAEVQLTFVRETLQYKLLRDEFEAGADITMPDTIYNAFEAFDPYNRYVPYVDMYEEQKNDAYRRLGGLWYPYNPLLFIGIKIFKMKTLKNILEGILGDIEDNMTVADSYMEAVSELNVVKRLKSAQFKLARTNDATSKTYMYELICPKALEYVFPDGGWVKVPYKITFELYISTHKALVADTLSLNGRSSRYKSVHDYTLNIIMTDKDNNNVIGIAKGLPVSGASVMDCKVGAIEFIQTMCNTPKSLQLFKEEVYGKAMVGQTFYTKSVAKYIKNKE